MKQVVVVLLLAITVAAAQEKQAPNMEEMMKKMMEIAAPGPMHKKLEAFVGKWDVKMSVQMDPSKPPVVSKGSAEFKSLLGGRFVMQECTGDMMGMTMNGIGFNGYDNIRKKYTMFWIDNMGTVMSAGDGNFDQTGKTLTFYSKMDEPTTGEFDKNVKYVTRWVDDNKFIFEIHDLTLPELNTKTMEMEYTRKK